MLAIVVVNYKNENLTVRYVKEELKKIRDDFIVVIVNNSANEQSNERIVGRLGAELITNVSVEVGDYAKKTFVISSDKNLGFAQANNLGYSFCKKHFDIKYVLFSNNDIRLICNNVVETLIHKLEENSHIGLIGPEVVGLDGERQSPEPYRGMWNKYVFMYWLTPFLTKRRKRSLFKLNYKENATEGFHYKIMGSFFVMRADDYGKCGMMDSNTFLYGEEVMLTERLMAIEKLPYFYPKVSVLHEHGKTISSYLDFNKRLLAMFESESYYYVRYKKYSVIETKLAKILLLIYLYLRSLVKRV